MGLINILKRDKYISREEYIKILTTRSIQDALKVIISKKSIPKIIEAYEKRQISFTDAMKQLDELNLENVHEELQGLEDRSLREVVEAIYEIYPVITAVISYQETGRLVSHLPSRTLKIIGESIDKYYGYAINSFIQKLLARYRAQRKIDVDSVLRVLDSMRNTIRNIQSYHEYLVTSIAYDMLLLSLCTIPLLKDAYFRPLLINASDVQSICKLIEVDPVSGIDSLRKTRPIFAGLVGLTSDLSRITTRYELIEQTLYLYPPFISYQILHAGFTEEILKNVFLYVRQVLLTRLALTFIHNQDEHLINQFRMLIERWVYP